MLLHFRGITKEMILVIACNTVCCVIATCNGRLPFSSWEFGGLRNSV